MCEPSPSGPRPEANCETDAGIRRAEHAKWILIAAMAFAAVACFVRSGVVIDDAMISFRYARHVALGHGLRWNTDEPPTEGYTNFLWVMLLTPIEWLGWDAYACARALGAACFLGSIALAYLVACRTARDQRAGLLAAWLLASNANLAYVSVLGMETSLFALAVLATTAAVVTWTQTARPGAAAVASLAALAATLVRPEGAGVGTLAAFIMLAYGGKHGGRTAIVWLSCFVVPLIVYASLRMWYFGHLLPNSFYIKSRGLALSTAGCQYVAALFQVSLF